MDRTKYIRIKFCGLTRLEDAMTAVRVGADMLGFNFYSKSKRYIAPDDCSRLVEKMRAESVDSLENVQLVGVFVNTPFQNIMAIMDQCKLDLAQLSGDETAREVVRLGERAFKAIRGNGRLTLEQVGSTYPQRMTPPALLVDAGGQGVYGGSGLTVDWNQAEALARNTAILLAGGLDPSNVAEAIRTVRPWGVDVASGIEASPGIKDHAKMVDFVQAVRDWQDRSH
jgi:phosphoribosylanthranilate isomerase